MDTALATEQLEAIFLAQNMAQNKALDARAKAYCRSCFFGWDFQIGLIATTTRSEIFQNQ